MAEVIPSANLASEDSGPRVEERVPAGCERARDQAREQASGPEKEAAVHWLGPAPLAGPGATELGLNTHFESKLDMTHDPFLF